MHGLLYPTLATLAWAAVGYRLLRLLQRGQGTPARHAVTSAVALLALTFTVSTPAVWTLADRVTGIDNISALVAHLCVVGFSTTIQLLLLWWANPVEVARQRAVRRLVFLGVVVLVLLGLFVAAGPTESHNTDFVATYAGRPLFGAYLLAYLAAFGTGLVDIIRICWPYARLAGPGTLRTGLRTTAVGAALGLLYCAARALSVLGVAAGWDVHRWEWVVPLASSGGALLVIAGLTLPSWWPRITPVGDLARQARLLRQLYPLWLALVDAVPTVRLAVGSRNHAPWRLAERLHRRVVEIYDARLVLRPYLSETVGDRARQQAVAAGLTGAELAAVVEAARLRAALRARLDGAGPRRAGVPGHPGAVPAPAAQLPAQPAVPVGATGTLARPDEGPVGPRSAPTVSTAPTAPTVSTTSTAPTVSTAPVVSTTSTAPTVSAAPVAPIASTRPPGTDDVPDAVPAELDEAGEIEHLARVARAFTRSPLVSAIVLSIVDDDASGPTADGRST